MTTILFEKSVPGIGCLQLRPLNIPGDIPLLHDWFNRDYARFWGMLGSTLQDVQGAYQTLTSSGHASAFIGLRNGEPAFLMEAYQPAHDEVGKHYSVEDGDIGMHFLVAPATQPVHGFTLAVMTVILDFLFATPTNLRVVVEPDVRNDKIHVLNRKAGFVYQHPISLPHKQAHLAFCRREDYARALNQEFA